MPPAQLFRKIDRPVVSLTLLLTTYSHANTALRRAVDGGSDLRKSSSLAFTLVDEAVNFPHAGHTHTAFALLAIDTG
jgi:hypothetical protein